MFDRRRFMLFAGRRNHPTGGWLNYVGAHARLEDALHVGQAMVVSVQDRMDWYHVVDGRTLKVIARGGYQLDGGVPRIEV